MLEGILQNIQTLTSEGYKSLAVFDLDSTLFDVSPRLKKILHDFAEFPANRIKFPEATALLSAATTTRSDWGIANALERAGIDESHPEFLEEVRSFWQKNFFSNHYLQFDDIYEGALEYVLALHKAGAHISYLTGRDEDRMGLGSREQLSSWGFPLNSKAELILKPHRSLDDAQFKTDYFVKIKQKEYKKIYFFENEPVNLVHLEQFCPEVEMIFFESTHAGKAQPSEQWPRIINFLMNSQRTS